MQPTQSSCYGRNPLSNLLLFRRAEGDNYKLGLVLSVLLIALSTAALGAESEDKARFSDKPAPLQLEGFPERPPLLLLRSGGR